MNPVPIYTTNFTPGAKCANCGKSVQVGFQHGRMTEINKPISQRDPNPSVCYDFGMRSMGSRTPIGVTITVV